MVFSRLNGTWPGAAVTQWDFSRYAAGVTERRLSFFPPYEHGLVLITPPQKGSFAPKSSARRALEDYLHPIYKGILKEYVTDGRSYYAADGRRRYSADTYYKTIESDIRERAKLLPLTVSGDVGWAVAQTAPRHLRLSLIDSGYINPAARTASVCFHTVKPKRVTDVLTGEIIDVSGPPSVQLPVRCGLFRFIDIELSQPLR